MDFLRRYFAEMDSSLRDDISRTGPPSEEQDHSRDRVEEYIEAQEGVLYGILDVEELLSWEVKQSGGGGRPKDIRVYIIAETVAEIYVLGTGKRPGVSGKSDTDGKYSTPFMRAVADVFAALGIDSDPLRPCKAARQEMTEERMRTLKSAASIRKRKRPPFGGT